MTLQLHTIVVVGEDVVVTIPPLVGVAIGNLGTVLGGGADGAKLLQEQLIIVGAHHHQLVDEPNHRHRGVVLQGCVRGVCVSACVCGCGCAAPSVLWLALNSSTGSLAFLLADSLNEDVRSL